MNEEIRKKAWRYSLNGPDNCVEHSDVCLETAFLAGAREMGEMAAKVADKEAISESEWAVKHRVAGDGVQSAMAGGGYYASIDIARDIRALLADGEA